METTDSIFQDLNFGSKQLWTVCWWNVIYSEL